MGKCLNDYKLDNCTFFENLIKEQGIAEEFRKLTAGVYRFAPLEIDFYPGKYWARNYQTKATYTLDEAFKLCKEVLKRIEETEKEEAMIHNCSKRDESVRQWIFDNASDITDRIDQLNVTKLKTVVEMAEEYCLLETVMQDNLLSDAEKFDVIKYCFMHDSWKERVR